jgi:predicted house-cleaning noncanonical NTP pyrophosphatase (MazG superfamily)
MKTVRVVYNKLVRDKIPDHLRKKGILHKSSPIRRKEQILGSLFRKLHEEVDELKNAKGEGRVSEFADVFEVLEEIARESGIKTQRIRRVQKKKRSEKGGFQKKILLYWTDVSDRKK